MTMRRMMKSLTAVCVMHLSTHVFAEPMVVNGDFESETAGFEVWPGYTQTGEAGMNPADIFGWTGEAGRGINPISSVHDTPAPFRDNGNNDTHVAFLQGTSYIEQTVSGFVAGNEYTVGLDFNSRNCCGDFPIADILIDGTVVGSSTDLAFPDGGVVPVADLNDWYHADIDFTATSDSHTIRIATRPVAGGDATLVVDNISVVPEPTSGGLAAIGFLALAMLRRRR